MELKLTILRENHNEGNEYSQKDDQTRPLLLTARSFIRIARLNLRILNAIQLSQKISKPYLHKREMVKVM